MDALTFAAAVIKAVAWPATVIGLVLLLRRPLRGLIPLLTRIKYRDFELEFGRKIEELQAEVAVALPEGAAQALPSGPPQAILKLAEVSPRAAVLEAWRELENAALRRTQRRIEARGGDSSKLRPHEALRELQREEALDPTAAKLLPVLRELRNRAAHAPEFALSSESAVNYAAIANRLARELGG